MSSSAASCSAIRRSGISCASRSRRRAPEAPERALTALREAARPLLRGDEVLGPAPLFRVRDRHRAQLLLKTSKPGRAGAVLGDLVARQGRALRRAEGQRRRGRGSAVMA